MTVTGKMITRQLGWMISILSVGYVAWQIYCVRDQWQSVPGTTFLAGAALTAILACVQLAVEAYKWRILLRLRAVHVSFSRAMAAVLAGFSAGAITPNRIGEYAGRMLVVGYGQGVTIVSQTLLDRISQSVPTWLAGIWLGWSLLGTAELRIEIFLAVVIASLLIFIGAWFLGDGLPWVVQIKVFLRQVAYELKTSPPKAWITSIIWSCVRYLIFVLQFIVLARAAGIEAPVMTITSFIASVFWLKSLMPFIGFSELGVRESIALSLSDQHGWPATPVVLATFTVYAFNNLLPTLAGAYLIRKYT